MRLRPGASLAVALIIAGCAARGAPRIERYRLATPPATVKHPERGKIEVDRVTSSEPFENTGIAYQTGAYKLDAYRYHRWIEPPTDMVQDYLSELLGPGSAEHPSADRLKLDARINAFQEVDEGESRAGLVEIKFCLSGSGRRLQGGSECWTSRRQNPAQAGGPEGAVAAINQSFEQVTSDLVGELDRRVGSHRRRQAGDVVDTPSP